MSLRPMVSRDEAEWDAVRWANREWLAPWESGDPEHGPSMSFGRWIQCQRSSEREGTGAVFVIEYDSRLVGQISMGAISYGSMRTAVVGYWVDQRFAGRGIAPTAVALLADWALNDARGPKLHRLEIAILPENQRSLRVVEKLHAHHEGLRERYMFVHGRWRDHETFSLLAEDAGDGFVERLMRRHARGQ